MGNSNSSSKAAAATVAVAVAAATTTAAWILSSYLSSELAESQTGSSVVVYQSGSSVVVHQSGSSAQAGFVFQSGSSARYELQNGSSTVKDVCHHCQSKESCKQKVEVHGRISRRSEAKQKSKAEDNKQILKHLIPSSCNHKTIKIMSYNIWSNKYYKIMKRMNALNHLIEQHSPDIVLLQEVTPEVYRYFQSCNWWDIYECSIKEETRIRQFFCMMLSKLPVNKFFHKHFVNTQTSKGVSVAKLTSNPKKTLTVATCHLKSPDGASTYDAERTSQAKEAIDLLKLSRNVVLGGDMNWDESTDGPFPLISGWCDAWSDLKPKEDGYTYDTVSNGMLRGKRFVVQKRLDRFICRLKDFDMIDIEIVGTEVIKGVSCKSNGKKLPLLPSDHYGLILTICAK